jgi:hypothetical protein
VSSWTQAAPRLRLPVGLRQFAATSFDTIGKSESFSFLYLNPPYDSEIGLADNKRMEYLFLEHTFRWLIEGGVLLMVVPQERLDSAIPLLAGNFTDLRIFRLTDPEAERFDQVALLGVRKRMRGEHYDRNRALLVEMVWRQQMPVLTGHRNTLPCASLESRAACLSWLASGPGRGRRSGFVHVEAGRALPLAKRRGGGWPTDHASPCRPCWAALHGRAAERCVRAGK